MSVEFLNPAGLSRGSYSHTAVVTGGRTVYVSGQVAFDEAGRVVGTTFAEQAERVLENLRIALAAGGAQYAHIVKMNVYVRDLTAERFEGLFRLRYDGDAYVVLTTQVQVPLPPERGCGSRTP